MDVEKKKNSWLPRGGRGIDWKIGIKLYTLLNIKLITEKNLLKNIGNSTQYSAMTYMEKYLKKNVGAAVKRYPTPKVRETQVRR